ncbi:putative glucosylceramidase 3 [Epargyreus clarus]|uniref:putative glucosylceramidase 3 n=1 Tax=Epargyreus clarus TaxID=520877 RepID=UPI003C2F1AE7
MSLEDSYSLILDLDPSCLYQTCEGFGGAVTDAASINWKSLPENMQQYMIDSYFSECGLEYNMMRLPIGGTDFSTHEYAYNECPENDITLSNYTLAREDYLYKIPMIKKAMEVATSPIHIVSTTWSPPRWMKTDFDFSHCGLIAPEYYQTYADYHLKFFEEYDAAGIPIWGVTTTNEPSNGLTDFIMFNCLGWTPDKMGHWIENNLGPTIRNSKYKDIKILCCDDQRPRIPFWLNVLADLHPGALDYIDGVAVHFYEDYNTPPIYLTVTTETHPDKFILGTEACEGIGTGVVLGSWERAKSYATDIIQDLNYNVVGWIDWNLCLDMEGGPNWSNNFVDSPIIVNAAAQEFYKQPTFYAMGHFAKFIPRGSRRIGVTASDPKSNVANVAFATTRNTIVVVLYNDGNATTATIRLYGKEAMVPLEANSICTVEICNPAPMSNELSQCDDNKKVETIELRIQKPVFIRYKSTVIAVL